MIVLGIASEHCSSASLMIDGEIVGLIQEERLSKRKNQVAFPLLAVRSLIDRHLAGDSQKIRSFSVVRYLILFTPLWTGSLIFP